MATIPIDSLRQADLFAGLTEEQIETLATLGERKTFHKGAVLMRAGEPGNNLCIVLEGAVEVYGADELTDAPGLVMLGEGQGFGEMSVIDAGARSATIRCATPEATLLVLNGPELLDFCKRECCIGVQIMTNLARDLAFKLRHRNLALLHAGQEEEA